MRLLFELERSRTASPFWGLLLPADPAWPVGGADEPAPIHAAAWPPLPTTAAEGTPMPASAASTRDLGHPGGGPKEVGGRDGEGLGFKWGCNHDAQSGGEQKCSHGRCTYSVDRRTAWIPSHRPETCNRSPCARHSLERFGLARNQVI